MIGVTIRNYMPLTEVVYQRIYLVYTDEEGDSLVDRIVVTREQNMVAVWDEKEETRELLAIYVNPEDAIERAVDEYRARRVAS